MLEMPWFVMATPQQAISLAVGSRQKGFGGTITSASQRNSSWWAAFLSTPLSEE
jgi:hypothetical protein